MFVNSRMDLHCSSGGKGRSDVPEVGELGFCKALCCTTVYNFRELKEGPSGPSGLFRGLPKGI